MESAVTAPVSGHIKRVVVQEGVSELKQSNSKSDDLCQGIQLTRATLLWKLFTDTNSQIYEFRISANIVTLAQRIKFKLISI